MPRPVPTLSLAALLIAAASAPALSQDTLTLFGQNYRVQRFDYSTAVTFPSEAFPGEILSMVEVEGICFSPLAGTPGTIYLSSDAVGDVFVGNPRNRIVQVQLLGTPANITGLQFLRSVVANDPFADGYNLDPAGVTINPTNSGLGAGGNLIVGSSQENLRAFGLQASNLGQRLAIPPATGICTAPAAACSVNLVGITNDCEDVTFVPAFGSRAAAFYVLNQEFPDQAQRVALDGQVQASGSVLIGGDAITPGFVGDGTPKGITYLADSPAFPATIRRPGGALMVGLDNDRPGIQVVDFTGALVAYEPLTVGGLPENPALLTLPDCPNQLQIESLTVDPESGRIFLVNQGDGLTCNILFILTPIVTISACSVADIVGIGGQPPADGLLTGDDFNAFIAAFAAGEALADITGIGGPPSTPDGLITGDDFNAFIAAFATGCP